MFGANPQRRPLHGFLLLPGKFSTQTCTRFPIHLARSFLECHLCEAVPEHPVYSSTPPSPPHPNSKSSISPSLLPPTFLCSPQHLTQYGLLHSELSKGTHCNCLIIAVFSVPNTGDDPQLSVEKVNDEDLSSHQCPPNLPAHAQRGLFHVHLRLTSAYPYL